MPATKKTETNDGLQTNMRFYSQFMTTPKEAQRAFNNGGFQGTDINPMFRIQKLTEVFGPSGFGWWTSNVRYDFVESPDTKEVSVFCELDLYVKDPATGEISQPIYGVGGNTYIKNWGQKGLKASDEAKKMAYTDAISIACKALGIGHDIWYGNDKTKYTMYSEEEVVAVKPKAETKPVAKAVKTEASTESTPTETQHTASSATLIAEIEDILTNKTKDMSKDDKMKLAKETIVPIVGMMNYKMCTDVEKLAKLRDTLKAA